MDPYTLLGKYFFLSGHYSALFIYLPHFLQKEHTEKFKIVTEHITLNLYFKVFDFCVSLRMGKTL
jgi:hypothetical protein